MKMQLCLSSSHTSAQPPCRAGPNRCVQGKSSWSSPSKSHTSALRLEKIQMNSWECDLRVCACAMFLCTCRFTADAEVDLEASLSALGITDLFSQEKADFRHLSEWKYTLLRCTRHSVLSTWTKFSIWTMIVGFFSFFPGKSTNSY